MKKTIFRIIGALASALIITSVFVPFISVWGYSYSLWQTYSTSNELYLPIMIMVFGAIAIIFFALNKKTEFAYMTSGAIIFFVVMITVESIMDERFDYLSLGYYFLLAGSFLTGLMAFLTNLKSNVKKDSKVVEDHQEIPVLDKMDTLYSNQVNETIPIIQPIQPQVPVMEEKNINEVNPVIEPIPNITPVQDANYNNVAPVMPNIIEPATQSIVKEDSVKPIANEDLFASMPSSNLNNQFSMPKMDEFLNFDMSNKLEQQPSNLESSNSNPAVQGFVNNSQTSATQSNGMDGLDIFGQSINK